MIATHRTWIVSSIAVAAALTGLLLSCSSPPPPPPAPSAGPVSDVRVETGDGGTVIALVGAGGSPYQASRSENPTRIVVELPGTGVAGAPTSTPVFDGWVQEVALHSTPEGDGEATTQVEVTLSQDAGFDVFPMGDSLEIHIGDPAQSYGEADPYEESGDGYAAIEGEELPAAGDGDGWVELDESAAMDDVWAQDADVAPAEDGASSIAADLGDDDASWVAADEGVAPLELKPATRLMAVDPEGSSEGTVIRIVADGMPSGFKSFTLDDPARLVIDMPGIQSEVSQSEMLVGSPHADQIRVGQHEDKVRVVIDGGSHQNPFDERQISPAPDGMVIALGGGAAVDAALADARAALQNPALAGGAVAQLADSGDAEAELEYDALPGDAGDAWAESGSELEVDLSSPSEGSYAVIEAVEFLPSADADRIVIQSDQPIDYSVFQPDPETYVLLFSGATLSPSASTQLLPDPGGPVSLVSAFAQPELETPQVRLVVKRAAGLEPSVGQFDSEIVLGFDRSGVASTLPVLGGETQVAGTTAPAKAMAQMQDDVAPLESEESFPAEQQFTVPAAIDADTAVDYLQEGGLLDGKEYMGRRISLDFKDVDIRDVLRLIADVSDLNVIAGDEVQGNVTIRLVDVPWDQALDVILLTKGLGFVRVGNVLRIAPADILKQEEEARLQERRAKEKLEDLVVKLQPVNYADVDEVSKLVTRLLTPRGSVDTDERTNTIIIKDIAAVIDEATALVKAIDSQTPQVMIEARIVEANLDFSREIGAELGFGTEPIDDESDFSVGGSDTLTLPDSKFPFNDSNNVVFSNPITNSATGLMNLGAFILDDKASVDFRLTAAELNGEGKVISSPRVVTLDNREALIEQGVSIPFQTFENGDAQLEFIDAVLQLRVTPHITADRSIIMSLEVSRNAPDGSVETPTGSPAIAKNQAQTETLIKDGQTLVIGGIYVIDKAETSSRVPYLWEMPVLGHLFKSTGLRDVRKELLIFVTPSIVVGPATDAAAG